MDAADGLRPGGRGRLLAGVDWQQDGYELFGIMLNGSSAWGWFEPMSEARPCLWPRPTGGSWVGSTSRRPARGGLVNHDLYRQACALEGAELITLLGEGTFHQFHGGAATSEVRMGGDARRLRAAAGRALRGPA
jgi:hypothetical protein